MIDIQLKHNFSSGKLTIPSQSKKLVKLPVSKQNGHIYVNEVELKPNLYISQGLYSADDWCSTVEVTNYSEKDITILLEQPLNAESYNSADFIECNNFNKQEGEEISPKDVTNLIRTNHLNEEERKKLLKLCRYYSDIMYKEGETLTFTNQIKHHINTTDDIPIYTKSYRYPYIHKVEVQSQITKMLEQGIIRHSYSPWSVDST